MTCKVQVPCPPQNKTEVTLLTPALWWAMRCLSCLLRAGCSKLTNQVCRICSADLVICFLLKQITIQVPCPLQNKTEVTLLTPVLWWAMRCLSCLLRAGCSKLTNQVCRIRSADWVICFLLKQITIQVPL